MNYYFVITFLMCRFNNGYKKGSTKRMVRTWAEKEYGNLMKMYRAGLPVPKPYLFKPPVILMDFLGSNGQSAHRLKVRLCHIFILI